MMTNWAYIMTNRERGRFYHGSTSQPELRLSEHRSGKGSKHVWKYNLFDLVWYQDCEDKEAALDLECRMKRKSRERKIPIIEAFNPTWRDLTEEWLAEAAATWM